MRRGTEGRGESRKLSESETLFCLVFSELNYIIFSAFFILKPKRL